MWRINLGIPTYNKKWVLEEDRDKEKTIKIHGKKRENRLSEKRTKNWTFSTGY